MTDRKIELRDNRLYLGDRELQHGDEFWIHKGIRMRLLRFSRVGDTCSAATVAASSSDPLAAASDRNDYYTADQLDGLPAWLRTP